MLERRRARGMSMKLRCYSRSVEWWTIAGGGGCEKCRGGLQRTSDGHSWEAKGRREKGVDRRQGAEREGRWTGRRTADSPCQRNRGCTRHLYSPERAGRTLSLQRSGAPRYQTSSSAEYYFHLRDAAQRRRTRPANLFVRQRDATTSDFNRYSFDPVAKTASAALQRVLRLSHP